MLNVLAKLLTARRGLLLLGLLAAAAFAVTLAVFAPGYMSRDSGAQLAQARSLALTDHHPILMALMWRVTDRIVPGPLGLLIVIAGLYWAGLAALFWALGGPLRYRALGLLGVGAFPPVFSLVPVIWKDTLMQAALLAGLACVAWPASATGRRVRLLLPVLALGLFLVAIGARHNAAAAVWPLLVPMLLALPVLAARPRWLRLLLACGVSLTLTFILAIGLKTALAPLARAENFWQQTATFDLAGISLRTGKQLVAPSTGVLTPGMGLEEIRRGFRADYNASLYYCIPFQGHSCLPLFNKLTNEEQLANLSRTWRQAIVAHPIAYLGHRGRLASALLGLRGAPQETYYLGGAPHHRLARDYPPSPGTIRALQGIERTLRWPGFAPWIYVLLGLLLLPLAAVRYLRGGPLLPVLLALSGLAYLLSVLVAAGTPDYRYTVWTILATLLAAITSLLPPLPEAQPPTIT